MLLAYIFVEKKKLSSYWYCDAFSAFSGMAPMTEEHLSLARALDVPIVIVITKTDMATPQQIQRTINDLKQTLTQPGYKRVSSDVGFCWLVDLGGP